MAYIRKVKTGSGATAVQLAHKSHGRIVRLEHIGSAHNATDLDALLALARQRIVKFQLSLFDEESDRSAPLQIGLRRSFSGLLFNLLREQYAQLGFDALEDEDFALLCIARIVEATSKLDSIRVLADLGVAGLTKDRLYRCLRRASASGYRTSIAEICVARAVNVGITLVLYDVTTLYFEIQQDDDFRKPGLSKERRLEPQIVVGLLVNQTGDPLGLHSFEGNKAETATMLPVVEEFRNRYHLQNITVVADAAMMSRKNLQELTEAGYGYIVGSRLNKIPYDIAEYQRCAPLTDGQIITENREGNRIIYQYRQKRADLDLRNIEKQIAKVEKIVGGLAPTRRTNFLTLKVKEKSLNQPLIDKARALAGIKGYVTNLDVPDENVIAYYHELFHVEATFRMAKSDLRARPIFHQTKQSIEAHLTVVFTALAIARNIERRTGMSIKHFVKTIRPIRSGVITVNGKEYIAEPELTTDARWLVNKLKAGH